MTLDELAGNPALFASVLGVLGLVIGSFLNVVIHRTPRVMQRGWARDAVELLCDGDVRREIGVDPAMAGLLDAGLAPIKARLASLPAFSLSRPRSRCPSCGHAITALENVPVLSWLALRGRCSSCRAPISIRYPLVEIATGVLFAAAALKFGFSLTLAAALVLTALLVCLTLIDADTMLLPDSLTQPLVWLGLLLNLLGGFVPLGESVIGAVAGYLAFWFIGTAFRILRGMDGMGAGDYKLLAGLGAWFGWKALLPIVLIAAGVGSVVGLVLMVSGRANLLTRLPFGVYLAPAGMIMLFFGPLITSIIVPGVH